MIQLIVQYAHRNIGTAVSLKVVTGGVRYRAQRREQQKYLESCVLRHSANVLTFFSRHPFLGCRMNQASSEIYKHLVFRSGAPSGNEGADVRSTS